MSQPGKRLFLIFSVISANVAFDQLSKFIVRTSVTPDERTNVLGDFLVLTRVENTGAFLSAGSGWPDSLRLIVLTILPTLLLLYGMYWITQRKDFTTTQLIGWCCVMGGGIGNIYDRIVHESVTDFLHMGFESLRTGIFNIADVSIVVGIGLIMLSMWKQNRTSKKAEADSAEADTLASN